MTIANMIESLRFLNPILCKTLFIIGNLSKIKNKF